MRQTKIPGQHNSQADVLSTGTPPDSPSSSSPRRIAASRANGAKSLGPITPQGKENATAGHNLTHGMLAQTVVLASESRPRFIKLLDDLIAEHRPFTRSEFALVETMAVARWRQMRTWSIQKSGLDREIALQPSNNGDPSMAAAIAFRNLSDNSNSLTLGLRYETTFERQFSRALRELTVLKSHRDPSVEAVGAPSTMASSTWDAVAPAACDENESSNGNLRFEPSPNSGMAE
jgi:hypothetical protein